MARIFIQRECIIDGTATLPEPEAKRLLRVLRMKPGDAVTLFDGSREYTAELTSLSTKSAQLRIISVAEKEGSGSIRIVLGQGMPKGEKLEMVIQKATELGASSVVPVIMERSVKRPEDGGKLERLRRIATEAAQQCGRVDVPEVPGYAGLDEFLKMTAEAQLKILPYEGEKARGLREVFAGLRSCRQKEKAADTGLQASHQPEGDHSHPPLVRDLQHHAQHLPPLDGTPEGPCWNLAGGRTAGQINSFAVAVLIGPEGGLTEDEVKKAEEAGFIPVSLGPRILRTETAGLAVVVLVQYQLGDI